MYYVQFEVMVYQQKVWIPMGTNCAPLIADLFLFCYERDFMSNLHKSKKCNLKALFSDRPEKTNLVEDIEILLPDNFH